MDYYEALGIAPDASIDEIERAYRATARKVHPDRNAGDAARADARMKQLNQIRETLTDPLLRAAYDDQLRRERADRPRPAPQPGAPPPRPAAPPPGEPPRSRPAAGYTPHPHVAPFLRTQVEVEYLRRPPPARSPWPALLALAGATALVVGAAVLWPRPAPPRVAPEPPAPVAQPRPRREGVVVVRGDDTAARRAIRKTAKIVPVGTTFDEMIAKYGAPDRVDTGEDGVLGLIYGTVRVELRDGRVVGGSP